MSGDEEVKLTGEIGQVDLRKNDVLSRGKSKHLTSFVVDSKEIVVTGGLVKTARLAEEWYTDIEEPESIVEYIAKSNITVDIFTFWQRLPETEKKYEYYMEKESIAALPIKNFDHWWKNQINAKTRNMVRKAERSGIDIKQVDFNQEFISGMKDIFNETPIRQHKPFWHYGKDVETIKREFSRYLFREDLFGAYYNGELIGFIFLAYAGKYALLGQIISKISHREKAPNNALIAKAVEICSNKKIPYLVYALWIKGSWGDFKRHNGFERFDLPRYYVPLTHKGQIMLKLRLHHGIVGVIPERLKQHIINFRKKWYSIKPSLRA